MPKSSKPKKNQGEKAGIHVGKDVTGNIVSGNHNTVTNNNIIQPAPLPETHAALGSIPPASADTYVQRGRIEVVMSAMHPSSITRRRCAITNDMRPCISVSMLFGSAPRP